MRRLTRVTNVICAGELHQQMAARDASVTEAEYDRIIYAKTACLTELAGVFGATGANDAQRAAAAAFGRSCGMAFQIADDCLDVAGDAAKVGKTLATDIERGRMTLPVIRWLAQGEAPAKAAHLLAATTPERVLAVRAEITASGAVASALATARHHVSVATAALAGLPPGQARDRLAELAAFIVSRDH
jgi:octaprenyl-diphosphate synthase